ncbi:hypothetical protein EKM03_06270 [Flavobacterium sp. GSP6]|nr:hypothetical protein EKM03_06270 [Flavobacterium sp. GSP6]
MLLKFIRINPYSLLHLSCKDKLFVMKSINPDDFKVIGKMERVAGCDACAQQVLVLICLQGMDTSLSVA